MCKHRTRQYSTVPHILWYTWYMYTVQAHYAVHCTANVQCTAVDSTQNRTVKFSSCLIKMKDVFA